MGWCWLPSGCGRGEIYPFVYCSPIACARGAWDGIVVFQPMYDNRRKNVLRPWQISNCVHQVQAFPWHGSGTKQKNHEEKTYLDLSSLGFSLATFVLCFFVHSIFFLSCVSFYLLVQIYYSALCFLPVCAPSSSSARLLFAPFSEAFSCTSCRSACSVSFKIFFSPMRIALAMA